MASARNPFLRKRFRLSTHLPFHTATIAFATRANSTDAHARKWKELSIRNSWISSRRRKRKRSARKARTVPVRGLRMPHLDLLLTRHHADSRRTYRTKTAHQDQFLHRRALLLPKPSNVQRCVRPSHKHNLRPSKPLRSLLRYVRRRTSCVNAAPPNR